MTCDQLKISELNMVVTIAQKGSFSKAAEALYIAQPALSRKIGEMEKKLDCRLFERSTRNVALTEAGKIFVAHAQRMIWECAELEREIENRKRTLSGQVICGYTPIGGHCSFLFAAIEQMSRTYPGVRIDLQRFYPPVLIEKVKNGELDCCLITAEAVKNEMLLEWDNLKPMYFYLIVPRQSRYAGMESMDVREIFDEPLVLMTKEKAPNLCHSMMDAAAICGKKLERVTYVEDVDELLMYVRIGRGLGVLTGPAEDLNLHSIRLTGNIARKTRSLVWRKNRGGGPCLQAFIHAVEQAVQENL